MADTVFLSQKRLTAPFIDITAAKAYDFTNVVAGVLVNTTIDGLFYYNASSTVDPDDKLIFAPNAITPPAPGRLIKITDNIASYHDVETATFSSDYQIDNPLPPVFIANPAVPGLTLILPAVDDFNSAKLGQINLFINDSSTNDITITDSTSIILDVLPAGQSCLVTLIDNSFPGGLWEVTLLNENGEAASKDVTDNTKPLVASVDGTFVVNNFVAAADTAGTIKDSGVAPSDATKPHVASVDGPTSVTNVALFSDTNGTITDGGALGEAAFKSVTDNTLPVVPSLDGPVGAGHVVIFSDGNGTITAGGILGTAAAKDASDIAESIVASVSGPVTIGNLPLYNSTTGTLIDGPSPSDFIPIIDAANFLQKANNLSDVANAATSRTNLGLGTSATRTASNTAFTNVSSVITPTISNRIPIFSDINGTLTTSSYVTADFLLTTNKLSELSSPGDAAAARINISAASSGVNSDITSLTGIASAYVGIVGQCEMGNQAFMHAPPVAGQWFTIGGVDTGTATYHEFIRFTSNATATCNLDDAVTKNGLNIYRGPTLNTNGVLYATSTLGVASTAAGATGRVLASTTGSAPAFTDTLNGDLVLTASTSGITRTFTVAQTQNTASSTAKIVTSVAGSSAGDAYFQSSINGGQTWSFGGDNSDSDAFIIAGSTALGTSNYMRINTIGAMSKPEQPCWQYTNGTLRSNVTGAGTTYTIPFDFLVFDQANNSAGSPWTTWTMTSAGRYLFNVTLLIGGVTAAMSSCVLSINTSNRNYQVLALHPGNCKDIGGNLIINGTVIADMDIGDSVTCTIVIGGGAGNTCSISVSGYTKFYGCMLC